MLTTSGANAAHRDPEVRKALKEQQIARLAAKGTPAYAELYASQPDQIEKAAEQREARLARKAAKDALHNAILKNVNETTSVFLGAAKPTKGAK